MAQIGPDGRKTILKPRKPLNSATLRDLALAYVSRYATSRAKLVGYLARKLRAHGWEEETSAGRAVETIADLMVSQRFVDDRAFAEMKAGGLVRRGYGVRRVRQALGAAGISETDAHQALEEAAEGAEAAALAFARRRRLGPFARVPQDPHQREKAMAAMLRAGHDYTMARRILDLPPESVHNDNVRSED